jgi:hypothetical protein
MFFENYDAKRVAKIVKNILNSGKTEISLKAKTPEVLAVLKRRLLSEGGMNDILASIEGNKHVQYSYVNSELNILHIIVK